MKEDVIRGTQHLSHVSRKKWRTCRQRKRNAECTQAQAAQCASPDIAEERKRAQPATKKEYSTFDR